MEKHSLFDRFVDAVNLHPIIWVLSSGLALYFVAVVFVLFGGVPHDGSYSSRFTTLVAVGVALVGYHWFVSRYVRVSAIAQVIQLLLALIPVVGIALIMSGITA